VERSLWVLLSLLEPRRLLLAGARGPTLEAALAWASAGPRVVVLRRATAADAIAGDLVVAERAELLPAPGAGAGTALLPATERDRARDLGWGHVAGRAGAAILIAAAPDAPEAPAPGVDARAAAEGSGVPAAPLGAYARARLSTSRELDALGRRARNGAYAAPPAASSPVRRAAAPAPGAREPLAIIVPVHNAAAELRRCLHALARHTTWPCELILIDDASTEPEISDVLAEAAALTSVRVLRSAVNLGFTATVNRGLRATAGDVVLLNSDTEVGPRWLEHLVGAAHGQPGVATVTPVSDNAGAFAVPVLGEANATPLGLDLTGVVRRIALAGGPPVTAPTGSGFCMYIRRAAIEQVGMFDAEGFPRGYGEENDFCLRARRAGWTHLVDSRTFVHHVGEASFAGERAELAGGARALIDARYPEYTGLVREFVSGAGMTGVRGRVERAYREPEPPRPRVLTVIHEGGGGTWIANLELMRGLERDWEPLMLTCDRRTVRLWRMRHGELTELRAWELERSIRVLDFTRHDYAEIVRAVLEESAIELVHVRHLFKHTFDVPRIAAALGIPVVFSFHDFYFTCPTVNLLDDRDAYCAARCTPGDGACRVPGAGLDGLPHLKHSYVHQWREEVEAMLRDADAFVTTSAHARDVHRDALPSLAGRPFELIEHGRTLSQRAGLAGAPQPGDPIRIMVVANLDVHKGADYIRALRTADPGQRLEFHLLGAVPDAYADLGRRHGSFPAGTLAERAAEIAPAFAGCLSITPETYSHSLTEAWALGIPVIGTELGALRERILAHGGGVLVPPGDPAEAVRRICAAADDPVAYARLRERATLHGCASVDDMTDAYATLYRRVLDARRPIAAPAARGVPARLGRGVVRLLAVVPGADGVHPGSAYVRIVQRYRHPGLHPTLSTAVRRADQDPLARPADLVLVQRTALDPAQAEEFVAVLRERGTPLLLDLDDHLLLKSPDDPDYGRHRRTLELLIDAAALVLVSNERLRGALADRARNTAVVPNLIDERLFLAGIERAPRAAEAGAGSGERPARSAGGGKGPTQIVYVGSPTHHEDLERLRPVMAALQARSPGAFQLNVVGVEAPGPGQDWYRRVVVPDACKPYPRFVPWLREQRPGWDVAVAPLRDTEFNRYKSDLKYLEYAALGLPGVFSACPAYDTVESGRTGLVAGEGTEPWVDALTALREDPETGDALAAAAFTEVTAHRLLRHGTDELLELLCGVAAAVPEPMMAA
jgi:GT2 family glycosyltransferase/glycosyltransferase involved in cell wall biosynthesis